MSDPTPQPQIHIYIFLSSTNIKLFPKKDDIGVEVNGVPPESLPYFHPSGFCTPLSHHHILN